MCLEQIGSSLVSDLLCKMEVMEKASLSVPELTELQLMLLLYIHPCLFLPLCLLRLAAPRARCPSPTTVSAGTEHEHSCQRAACTALLSLVSPSRNTNICPSNTATFKAETHTPLASRRYQAWVAYVPFCHSPEFLTDTHVFILGSPHNISTPEMPFSSPAVQVFVQATFQFPARRSWRSSHASAL